MSVAHFEGSEVFSAALGRFPIRLWKKKLFGPFLSAFLSDINFLAKNDCFCVLQFRMKMRHNTGKALKQVFVTYLTGSKLLSAALDLFPTRCLKKSFMINSEPFFRDSNYSAQNVLFLSISDKNILNMKSLKLLFLAYFVG